MQGADWYISPADRFSYETQFSKYSNDEDYITLPQLDPVFHQSRLQTEEFLQIWQLIDIKYEQRLNKCQFVYFMHILMSRRRGRPLPIGLPLNVKEEFLKAADAEDSRVYVRPAVNVRDVGASATKSTQDLEAELAQLELDVRAAERERQLAKQRMDDLMKAKTEIEGITKFTKQQEEALDIEITALRESVRGSGGSLTAASLDSARLRDLISKISIDRQHVEQIALDLRREQDAANRALAGV